MAEELMKREAQVVNAVSDNPLLELERASIDIQVATAHQYPRSLTRFKENALALVTLDEETAASCLYRRPVGKDKHGVEQYAEGMSIRMAEIVAGCYGNLRVGTRVIESNPRYVVVQGVAHDLETNFLSTAECKEATVNRHGQPYDERMRIVVEKAAAAKARRDAIFAVVPRASAKFLETAAKDLLFGNSSSISKWRDRIAKWVKTLGINEKRVWNALGVKGAADLKQSEIETLIGIQTALKNGDITIDEAFPEIELKNVEAKPTEEERVQKVIDQLGIPFTVDEVKAYVQKSGEMFIADTVIPNLKKIADRMAEGGQENA